jgi:adenylate kinase
MAKKTKRAKGNAKGKPKGKPEGKLVLILGPSGVGKTAVVTQAIKGMEDRIELVNFGHITQQVVGADRDKFRREASVAAFRKMQSTVAKRIEAIVKKSGKLVLVTSHSVMFRESGFVPGFPKWVLDNMDVKLVVLISALPEEIAGRKAKDAAAGQTEGRTRDEVPLKTILAEQEIGRAVAYSYSMYSGALIKEIVNMQGHLEESAAELREALERL